MQSKIDSWPAVSESIAWLSGTIGILQQSCRSQEIKDRLANYHIASQNHLNPYINHS